MYSILLYELVDDYLERRTQYREEHLRLGREAHARGELHLGGAFIDATEAAIVFTAPKAVAEAFAENDPYVKHGIVKKYRAFDWKVAIGGEGS